MQFIKYNFGDVWEHSKESNFYSSFCRISAAISRFFQFRTFLSYNKIDLSSSGPDLHIKIPIPWKVSWPSIVAMLWSTVSTIHWQKWPGRASKFSVLSTIAHANDFLLNRTMRKAHICEAHFEVNENLSNGNILYMTRFSTNQDIQKMLQNRCQELFTFLFRSNSWWRGLVCHWTQQ